MPTPGREPAPGRGGGGGRGPLPALPARIVAALQPPQFIEPAQPRPRRDGPGHGRRALTPSCSTSRPTSSATCWPATAGDPAQRGRHPPEPGPDRHRLHPEHRRRARSAPSPSARARAAPPPPVELVPRSLFNPNLSAAWFAAVTAVINNVTSLASCSPGRALIREQEHGHHRTSAGDAGHPLEIMLSSCGRWRWWCWWRRACR